MYMCMNCLVCCAPRERPVGVLLLTALHVFAGAAECFALLLPCPCRVYELYCDYVLKNPFHEMDQVRLRARLGGP